MMGISLLLKLTGYQQVKNICTVIEITLIVQICCFYGNNCTIDVQSLGGIVFMLIIYIFVDLKLWAIPNPVDGSGGGTPRKITLNDAWTYLMEVKETFQSQREKYGRFLKVIKDFKAKRYTHCIYAVSVLE